MGTIIYKKIVYLPQGGYTDEYCPIISSQNQYTIDTLCEMLNNWKDSLQKNPTELTASLLLKLIIADVVEADAIDYIVAVINQYIENIKDNFYSTPFFISYTNVV